MFPFSLSSDFIWSIITGILHYYSMAHTEGPLWPLQYEQVNTQVFIHSITVPTLDVLLLLYFPPTQAIVSKSYVYQYNAKTRTTSWANHQRHNYILIAPEKCTDVPICWTTFPPQAVELCKIRAGRTAACCNLYSVRQDPSLFFPFSPYFRYESIFSRFRFWNNLEINFAISRFHSYRSSCFRFSKWWP